MCREDDCYCGEVENTDLELEFAPFDDENSKDGDPFILDQSEAYVVYTTLNCMIGQGLADGDHERLLKRVEKVFGF